MSKRLEVTDHAKICRNGLEAVRNRCCGYVFTLIGHFVAMLVVNIVSGDPIAVTGAVLGGIVTGCLTALTFRRPVLFLAPALAAVEIMFSWFVKGLHVYRSGQYVYKNGQLIPSPHPVNGPAYDQLFIMLAVAVTVSAMAYLVTNEIVDRRSGLRRGIISSRNWTTLPVARFNIYGMLGYVAAAGFLLWEASVWLLDPHPYISPHAPRLLVWGLAAFTGVTLPVVISKLIHSASGIRLSDEYVNASIAFFFHRFIPKQDLGSVRCHAPKPNGPDCRIVYAGGYFDVFLPQDERREDLAKRLMELSPESPSE